MSLPLQERLTRFPPVMCYLLARRGNNRHVSHLNVKEIADRSGMAVEDVAELSWSVTWDQIPVRFLIDFPRACGVLMDDRHNIDVHYRFMIGQAERGWPYLQADSKQYQREFVPRLDALQTHILKREKQARGVAIR